MRGRRDRKPCACLMQAAIPPLKNSTTNMIQGVIQYDSGRHRKTRAEETAPVSDTNVYTANNLLGFQYAYDQTSTFKTTAGFYNGPGTTWTLGHQETYGYNPNFDYLTSA